MRVSKYMTVPRRRNWSIWGYPQIKSDSLNFKCTVIVPCQMKRNWRKRRNISVSPCKHSRHSTVRRLEQPARYGWRRQILCGEGVESQPEPIIPLCLLRLQTAQIPREAYPAAVHSFVSLPHLPVWEEESGGTPSDSHPPFLQPSNSVDKESSVKGRPLSPLHLSIISGPYLDPMPLTFRWLICDFWWMTFPSVLQGEVGSSGGCMLRLYSVQQHHVISRSPSLWGDFVWWASWISEVMLISRRDILFTGGREHCVWQKKKRQQHFAPPPLRPPRAWKLTSLELLLNLLPYGNGWKMNGDNKSRFSSSSLRSGAGHLL